ncbi:MAG TPA: hypothetical protein VNK24_06325 [Elusimicrobiota bacterium]|nr:hypothetical protein [Elusimicrobiota bacterium]
MAEQDGSREWLLWVALLFLAFAAGGLIANRKRLSWPPDFSVFTGLGGSKTELDSSVPTTQTDVGFIPAVRIRVKRPSRRY